MGYDLVVIDPEGKRLAATELGLSEHAEIAGAARSGDLTVLAGFPAYWGEEREVSTQDLASLVQELSTIVLTEGSSPLARQAAQKITEIANMALEHECTVVVVPD